MGANWSPEPDLEKLHRFVKSCLFRWGSGILGPVVVVTLRRIKTQERMRVHLYGDECLQYRWHVLAIGPTLCCLGFDRDMASHVSVSITSC